MMKYFKIVFFIIQICSFFLIEALQTTWTPSIQISSLGQNASSPRIAVDKQGNGVAIWIEQNAIYGSRISYQGSWSDPQNISGSDDAVSHPCLAIDSHGNATAVWANEGIIKVSILPFMGSWSIPQSLSGAGASYPQLAVDADGNNIVIWSLHGAIQACLKPTADNWQDPVEIVNGENDFPQISIGSNGTIVAIWHSKQNSSDLIYSAFMKMDNPVWSQPELISNPLQKCVKPQIAVDASGNTVAIWFRYDITNQNVFYNVIPQGVYRKNQGEWSFPEDLSEPGIYNPMYLDLKVFFSPKGKAFSLWRNSTNGSTFNIQGSSYLGRWFNLNSDYVFQDPTVSVDPYVLAFDFEINSVGIGFGAYMKAIQYGSGIEARVAQTEFAAFNDQHAGILSAEGINGYPKVSSFYVNNQSGAIVVWEYYNGMHTTILASQGKVELIAPPTGLAVVQMVDNHQIFQDHYNLITWEKSSSANASGYYLFRNGQYVARLDSFTNHFTDHNRIPNESVVYSIFTIDQDQSQSIPAIIHFP